MGSAAEMLVGEPSPFGDRSIDLAPLERARALNQAGDRVTETWSRLKDLDYASLSPEMQEKVRLSVLGVIGHVVALGVNVGGMALGGLLTIQGINQFAAGDIVGGPIVFAIGSSLASACYEAGKNNLKALSGKRV